MEISYSCCHSIFLIPFSLLWILINFVVVFSLNCKIFIINKNFVTDVQTTTEKQNFLEFSFLWFSSFNCVSLKQKKNFFFGEKDKIFFSIFNSNWLVGFREIFWILFGCLLSKVKSKKIFLYVRRWQEQEERTISIKNFAWSIWFLFDRKI